MQVRAGSYKEPFEICDVLLLSQEESRKIDGESGPAVKFSIFVNELRCDCCDLLISRKETATSRFMGGSESVVSKFYFH